MSIQTKAQAAAELTKWYAAREACTAGKSFTIVTSAGTRVVTKQNLREINETIAMLERKVATPDGTGQQSGHNFALSNFNNSVQR